MNKLLTFAMASLLAAAPVFASEDADPMPEYQSELIQILFENKCEPMTIDEKNMVTLQCVDEQGQAFPIRIKLDVLMAELEREDAYQSSRVR